MASLSDHAETLIANFVANNTTATRPTAWHLALYTAAPNDAGGGTELSGLGYSRQAITFGAASSGVVQNTSTHTFTASGGSWGTVSHYGIFDASTSGNLLWHGALTASRTVGDGEQLTVAVGAFSLTIA